MMIVIANSKGGVGKSTIAVHLAAWLHEQKHSVILVDCDHQHSSSDWIKDAVPELRCVTLSSTDDIMENLPQLKNEAEYIIADGPGSNTDVSRNLLFIADLAIVPCKASMLEYRALSQATMATSPCSYGLQGQAKGVYRSKHGGQELSADEGHEGSRGGPSSSNGKASTNTPASLCRRPWAARRRVAYGNSGEGGRAGDESVFQGDFAGSRQGETQTP